MEPSVALSRLFLTDVRFSREAGFPPPAPTIQREKSKIIWRLLKDASLHASEPASPGTVLRWVSENGGARWLFAGCFCRSLGRRVTPQPPGDAIWRVTRNKRT